MYKLVLPGNFKLVYTPRGSFPVEKYLNSSCGEAGSMTIAQVYDDKILWWGSCGGVLPDPEEDPEAYQQVKDCERSYHVVDAFYPDQE
jgi:hypothetical protein